MLITVVTIAYNAQEVITDTVESVLDQTYRDFQYIIQDGNSSDETVSRATQLLSGKANVKIFSENDLGIYNAMNRATLQATGQYIFYLNAGDKFANVCVLNECADILRENNPDFLYGSVIGQFADYTINYNPSPLHTFYRSKPFHHQAVFTRTLLAQSNPFDLNYKICADHDFAYKYYGNAKFFKTSLIICVVDLTSGVSKEQFKQTFRETYSISKKNGASLLQRAELRIRYVRTILVKKFIPRLVLRVSRKLLH